MLKRPQYIALGLIVLTTLIMLNLPGKLTARMKLGIGSVFLPLFGLANSSQQMASQVSDAAATRGELLKQNETLRRENQELRLKLIQADQIAHENDRLHKRVGWTPSRPWKFKLGRVVLREPANWWRTV